MTKEFKQKIEIYFFLALLVFLSIAFYQVIFPFWISILCAALFAYYLQKPYRFLTNQFNFSKSIASLLITFLIFLFVFLPFLALSFTISFQMAGNYLHFKNNWSDIYMFLEKININQFLVEYFSLNETIEKEIAKIDIQKKFLEMLTKTIEFLFQILRSTFINFSKIAFHFLLLLYMMYYFIIEGSSFLNKIKAMIPLPNKEKNLFFINFIKITDATMIGTILIGIFEGTFGGFLLWILGYKFPLLLGIFITFISILPLLGTNTVFMIVIIYEFVTKDFFSALLVLFLGIPLIVVSQYIIKPKFVGERSGIHPVLIALSTLGGIIWMGLIGVLIGPLIVSFFIAIWRLFEIRSKVE